MSSVPPSALPVAHPATVWLHEWRRPAWRHHHHRPCCDRFCLFVPPALSSATSSRRVAPRCALWQSLPRPGALGTQQPDPRRGASGQPPRCPHPDVLLDSDLVLHKVSHTLRHRMTEMLLHCALHPLLWHDPHVVHHSFLELRRWDIDAVLDSAL